MAPKFSFNESPKGTGYLHGFSPEERFLLQSDWGEPEDDCVEWMGTRSDRGYGKLKVGDKTVLAHRYSYEYFRGPITNKMTVDHLCYNLGCVNPWHLELVSRSENVRRARARREVLITKEAERVGQVLMD